MFPLLCQDAEHGSELSGAGLKLEWQGPNLNLYFNPWGAVRRTGGRLRQKSSTSRSVRGAWLNSAGGTETTPGLLAGSLLAPRLNGPEGPGGGIVQGCARRLGQCCRESMAPSHTDSRIGSLPRSARLPGLCNKTQFAEERHLDEDVQVPLFLSPTVSDLSRIPATGGPMLYTESPNSPPGNLGWAGGGDGNRQHS